MVHTRQEFAEYCLRFLGAPVLEINVDDTQLEDRIDEAIEYWRIYHHEGIEKVYLKHKITPSALTVLTGADQFNNGEVLTGQTSGATARVVINRLDGDHQAPFYEVTYSGNTIYVDILSGTFVEGETISNGTLTSVIDTGGVTVGDINNKYIETVDAVYGVSRVLPLAGSSTSKSIFDIQYQLRLNDLYDLTSTTIIYYKQVMSHLALLDMELNGKPMFRFNRLQNRIHLDINWDGEIAPGEYVVVEAYRALDPEEFIRVWNEPWLKHYACALIKRQWAINLKKFVGIQLPGGVQLDGQSMYLEAMQEIKDLEEELQIKSAPLEFFMG
jgi:hypothetical protein